MYLKTLYMSLFLTTYLIHLSMHTHTNTHKDCSESNDFYLKNLPHIVRNGYWWCSSRV